MGLNNHYQKCNKISERKFRQILRYFAQNFTASDTAQLTGISVRSINSIFLKPRKRIAQECEKQSPLEGVIELDESHFGVDAAGVVEKIAHLVVVGATHHHGVDLERVEARVT